MRSLISAPFVEAVDLLGGLDFDVPMDMDYDDPDQNLFIHLKAGEQHLTGEQLNGSCDSARDTPMPTSAARRCSAR